MHKAPATSRSKKPLPGPQLTKANWDSPCCEDSNGLLDITALLVGEGLHETRNQGNTGTLLGWSSHPREGFDSCKRRRMPSELSSWDLVASALLHDCRRCTQHLNHISSTRPAHLAILSSLLMNSIHVSAVPNANICRPGRKRQASVLCSAQEINPQGRIFWA